MPKKDPLKECEDLFVLLDDPDPVSVKYVNERVFALGEDALYRFVAMTEMLPEGAEKKRYMVRISSLCEYVTLKRLDMEISTGYPDIPESMYLITRLMNPFLSKGYFKSLYEDLGDTILADINDMRTAVENVEIFNFHFFKRFKVQDRDVTHDLRSGNILVDVLKSCSGLSVMMVLIYFMVARYVGLRVFPVAYNNEGYIPGYVEKSRVLFVVNIFEQGRIVDLSSDRHVYHAESDLAVLGLYSEVLSVLAKRENNFSRVKLLEIILSMINSQPKVTRIS